MSITISKTFKTFVKRPVKVQAIQFTGDNHDEINEFVGRAVEIYGNTVTINTIEGMMRALEGDWIIKGIKGEFYPCKPDIFEETYEEVK